MTESTDRYTIFPRPVSREVTDIILREYRRAFSLHSSWFPGVDHDRQPPAGVDPLALEAELEYTFCFGMRLIYQQLAQPTAFRLFSFRGTHQIETFLCKRAYLTVVFNALIPCLRAILVEFVRDIEGSARDDYVKIEYVDDAMEPFYEVYVYFSRRDKWYQTIFKQIDTGTTNSWWYFGEFLEQGRSEPSPRVRPSASGRGSSALRGLLRTLHERTARLESSLGVT